MKLLNDCGHVRAGLQSRLREFKSVSTQENLGVRSVGDNTTFLSKGFAGRAGFSLPFLNRDLSGLYYSGFPKGDNSNDNDNTGRRSKITDCLRESFPDTAKDDCERYSVCIRIPMVDRCSKGSLKAMRLTDRHVKSIILPVMVELCSAPSLPSWLLQHVNNMHGHKMIKTYLIEFWFKFGGKKNKGFECSQFEKLQALKVLAATVIPFNKQQALEVRREIFNASKGKLHSFKRYGNCFVCLNEAHARHHIIQLKNGGINSKKNLVSLCDPCHELIHPWMKNPSIETL